MDTQIKIVLMSVLGHNLPDFSLIQNCRSHFRKMLNESTTQLLTMSKKMHEAIEKSRPYYEARQTSLSAQQETQQAATR